MSFAELIPLLLKASIFLTVFALGLQATVEHVLYVLRRPALLARSLLAMYVLMPIKAVALAVAFDLIPSVEIALLALRSRRFRRCCRRRNSKQAAGHRTRSVCLSLHRCWQS